MAPRHKPRGRPFQRGNPGRPRGSRNRANQILAELADAEVESLVRVALQRAKDGQAAFAKLIFERVLPVRRGQPITLDLPPLESPGDVTKAMLALWNAFRDGLLTAEEAVAVATVADRSMQAIELEEQTRRLEEIEKLGDQVEDETADQD